MKWEELRGKPKWLVISGKVYDISDFLDEHPGGEEVMLEVCGAAAASAPRATSRRMLKVEAVRRGGRQGPAESGARRNAAR